MSDWLPQILERHDILLTCGTGGVGKTTLAAALGLAAAHAGKQTLVVTIDPARRLANALGLHDFDTDIVPVWPEFAEDANTGSLDAMMLDVKSTFDSVIDRYAPDPDTAARIFANPLYRELSTLISGSQEYMAMEALYTLRQDHNYDLIILDTPPTQHALDFFRAPLKLSNALSDSMLKFFLKPSLVAGKFGARLVSAGSDAFMRLFGKMAGMEMIQEISDLLNNSVSLFSGFEERAKAVHAMLHHERTGIVLVSAPQEHRIDDALQFTKAAQHEQMRIVASLCNRMPPYFAESTFTPDEALTTLQQRLEHNRLACNHSHAAAKDQHARLSHVLDQTIPRIVLAERSSTPNTLTELWEITYQFEQPTTQSPHETRA